MEGRLDPDSAEDLFQKLLHDHKRVLADAPDTYWRAQETMPRVRRPCSVTLGMRASPSTMPLAKQYLRRLEFPHRDIEMKQASGRTLWVVGKGEFDEPYVVRYRIEPGN
jgi:hypothetical protein